MGTLGLAFWQATKYLLRVASTDLSPHVENIATGVQTYTMALIAIMAGFVAITTTAKDSYWMRTFCAEGLMREYTFFYCFTIVMLMFCFLLSLVAVAHTGLFAFLFGYLLVATLQVIIVMIGAHEIVRKSAAS